MSKPETPGLARESGRSRRSFGALALRVALCGVSRRESKRNIARSLREAVQYERQADQASDKTARTRHLFAAGRSFLNGRQPRRALRHLEAVRPAMEHEKAGGSFYGFMGLADLYQSLAAAYQEVGQPEDRAAVQAAAEDLATQIETHFGIRTGFYPNGDRLTAPLPAATAFTA